MVTLKIEKLVDGGRGMGRDRRNRPIFVPNTISDEKIKARITKQTKQYTEAELVDILKRSPDRIEARCTHLGGDCTLQHITYEAQLRYKQEIVRDQFRRLKKVPIRPIKPHLRPWRYRIDTTLSPTKDGKLGYWSAQDRKIVALERCHLLHPRLQELLSDFDLSLPELRKVTLRVGNDGEVLIALEVKDVEPPAIESDFPVSVAIVFPDGVSATLIGDPFLIQQVKGRDFRVSAGSYFWSSWAGAEMAVEAVLEVANLHGHETIVECFSGVGTLTAFLADQAKQVIGIEKNPDAIEDAAINLDATENVALYNDWVENVLQIESFDADLFVLDCDPSGLSEELLDMLTYYEPPRLIISNPNLSTAARDARALSQAGFRLTSLQPLDLRPQTHHVHTVSHWVNPT